jgi:glyoxylase-like metal-dependent hydrolase (beta-lactamase superfamily II)
MIAAALALLLAAPDGGHHDRKPSDLFKLQQLAPNAWALYGKGGNVGFFVGWDHVVVVDSQFRDIAPGIEAQIRSVTQKPIRFLVNTHHHGDHVGGNEHFIRFAAVLAHDNVRTRMLASPAEIMRDAPGRIAEARKAGREPAAAMWEEMLAWAKKVKPGEVAAPQLTFASEVKLHLGDDTLHVWHTPPAHTDGDAVVLLEKAKVLHMGDLFFHQAIPVIDPNAGGSVSGHLDALDRVLARVPADAKVIPGHGEVADVAAIRAYRKYFEDLLALAKTARAKKLSREAFLKEATLPAYAGWKGYADRFATNAGAAYDETGRK